MCAPMTLRRRCHRCIHVRTCERTAVASCDVDCLSVTTSCMMQIDVHARAMYGICRISDHERRHHHHILIKLYFASVFFYLAVHEHNVHLDIHARACIIHSTHVCDASQLYVPVRTYVYAVCMLASSSNSRWCREVNMFMIVCVHVYSWWVRTVRSMTSTPVVCMHRYSIDIRTYIA